MILVHSIRIVSYVDVSNVTAGIELQVAQSGNTEEAVPVFVPGTAVCIYYPQRALTGEGLSSHGKTAISMLY